MVVSGLANGKLTRRLLFVFAGLGLLPTLIVLSVSLGAKDIPLATVAQSFWDFDPESIQQQIIRELRLSRTIAALVAGAGFAVAGVLMQGMTRNPLGSPDLLGVNAGATLALALAMGLAPLLSFFNVILCALAGAGLGAGVVYGLSSLVRGGMTPMRLALAGAAVSAFFLALSQGFALFTNVARDLAFWSSGGIANVKWFQIELMLPFVGVGLLLALFLSPSITVLSLGEDVATGLGQRKGWVKLGGNFAVLLLAGSAVAVVGPIGFVGLVIPHIVRNVVGVDYRWIVPLSALYGALLTLAADIGGRLVNPPSETPLGVITALIGVPFFVYLGRRAKQVLS